MLGICLMLNSCYHRHNSHQQHRAHAAQQNLPQQKAER